MRVFSFVVLAVWLSTGCHDSRRDSILAVRLQSSNFMAQAWQTFPNGRRIFFPKRYVNNAEQIDTSKCPGDFRIAWNDFILSYRHYADSGDSLGSIIEFTAAASFDNVPLAVKSIGDAANSGKEKKNAKAAVEDAFTRLENVEVKYGAR